MIKKPISFVFILITNFIFCQKQDAILYFNDGTSIEGLGMIEHSKSFLSKFGEDKIFFRITEADKADEWTFEDVKGITLIGFESDIKMEYLKLNSFDKPILLELVSEGNVNLYRIKVSITYYSSDSNFHKSDSVESLIYYLKRTTDEYPTKIGDNYIKKTAAYFSDCESLVKKIKNHEYSFENLDQMVIFYNDICSD